MRDGSRRSGFRYRDPDGRPVRDRRTLARIRTLHVPPAWHDVHIAASSASAVQAWGIDAKGRKQYRYHPKAIEQGHRRKYYRVRVMARDLPRIRETLHRDFHRGDLSRQRVAAGAVRFLNDGFFRVGHDRYVKENRTFGLTTLRTSHVTVRGDAITFAYTGKRGVRQWKVITDHELAQFIRALQRAPGSRLFRYRNQRGQWRDLSARDLNVYVREVTGHRYTAKDFRTWGGTLRFATVLAELGAPPSVSARKKNVVLAVRLVAAELGNTPAICRQSYIHPILVARYLDEGDTIAPRAGRARVRPGSIAHTPEELALIRFLDKHFPERRRHPRLDAIQPPAARTVGRRREGRPASPDGVRASHLASRAGTLPP